MNCLGRSGDVLEVFDGADAAHAEHDKDDDEVN